MRLLYGLDERAEACKMQRSNGDSAYGAQSLAAERVIPAMLALLQLLTCARFWVDRMCLEMALT